MIVTRTPYRISFFGGGTDFSAWYQEHGGDVLSATINHYNYISCRYLPPFHAEYRNKIAWRIMEYPDSVEDIQHNAIRAALLHYDVKQGVEISNQCDLPARSGLGSSSAFCASLIQSIYALKQKMITKYGLVKETIMLERDLLKEYGGIQDQIATVYGGLNYIHINTNGSFEVNPMLINEERKKLFNSKLMLFFTGVSRTSSELAEKQTKAIKHNIRQLEAMQKMTLDACQILGASNGDLSDFGRLLNETWQLKKSLSKDISTQLIDDIYQIGIDNGALGGKILGSGGGGFILFYADEKYQAKVRKALDNLIYVPFKFDDQGCNIVYYAPKNYDEALFKRRNYIHLHY